MLLRSHLLACFALTLLASGCKLVELKIPGEPLSKRDHAIRTVTREFELDFDAAVQASADEIIRHNTNLLVQADAVRWKIGASVAARKCALRTSPTAGLVDLWTFCRQMREFFDQGAGEKLFGASHPIAATNAVFHETRIASLAGSLLPSGEWKRMKEFVLEHSRQVPLQDLDFTRDSAVGGWEEFSGQTNSPPVGTTADALGDLSDRIHILGEQIPSETRWRLSLESQRMDEKLAETEASLRTLEVGLRRIAETAAAAPGSVSNATLELRGAFLPALDRFEKQWASSLEVIARERAALAHDLSVERNAVVEAFNQQRVAVMKDVEKMAGDVTERSLQQGRAVVKDVLRYAVLLALLVLGLPFVFGFLAGRISARGRRSMADADRGSRDPQRP